MRQCFETHLTSILSETRPEVPTPMLMHFYASVLLSVIESWVDSGMLHSAADLQRIYAQLVGCSDAPVTAILRA